MAGFCHIMWFSLKEVEKPVNILFNIVVFNIQEEQAVWFSYGSYEPLLQKLRDMTNEMPCYSLYLINYLNIWKSGF